ncbi:uncharacterized protein LOC121096908 [Falco naumanni]|uniref:uncharacterized protein LOC121096908 n=1 Tax=Falco naumanni TaxID=148594 RepID=UPI001ADE0CFA|nr:uncharacterized protein LOC121096908 [Falco naumanni]
MRPRRSPPPTAMPPLADPEAPPLPRDRDGDKDRDEDRDRDRGRRRLLLLLAALGAAALGAAAAAAALLGALPGGAPPQAATAAHVLLSAGSLALPSGPSWRYEEGISGVFLSEDVQVTAGKLRVTAGGLYLLYGQFALTCTAPTCPPGTVTLQLWRAGSQRPLLAIPLVLAGGAGSTPERSGLIQAIGQLQPGDVLSLALDKNVAEDTWQLAQDEREGNFVGLLRIAGG